MITPIKKTIHTVALSAVLLTPLLHALAQDSNTPGDQSGGGLGVRFENPFGNNITSIPQFIGKIVDLMINFGGVIVVFFIILAGFKFVIAQGSPEKIKSAKNMLMWTLIGAVVLLGSKLREFTQ